jgi:hypothetical protein
MSVPSTTATCRSISCAEPALMLHQLGGGVASCICAHLSRMHGYDFGTSWHQCHIAHRYLCGDELPCYGLDHMFEHSSDRPCARCRQHHAARSATIWWNWSSLRRAAFTLSCVRAVAACRSATAASFSCTYPARDPCTVCSHKQHTPSLRPLYSVQPQTMSRVIGQPWTHGSSASHGSTQAAGLIRQARWIFAKHCPSLKGVSTSHDSGHERTGIPLLNVPEGHCEISLSRVPRLLGQACSGGSEPGAAGCSAPSR